MSFKLWRNIGMELRELAPWCRCIEEQDKPIHSTELNHVPPEHGEAGNSNFATSWKALLSGLSLRYPKYQRKASALFFKDTACLEARDSEFMFLINSFVFKCLFNFIELMLLLLLWERGKKRNFGDVSKGTDQKSTECERATFHTKRCSLFGYTFPLITGQRFGLKWS